MQTNRHFSPSVAREAARELLAELPEDKAASTEAFWIGRLQRALEILLDAEPATAAECDEIIKAAIVAKSRLLGETSEPVPQPKPTAAPEPDPALRCDAAHEKSGAVCDRTRDHGGGHVQHRIDGSTLHYWPRHDGGSEDLDAALTPPGYSLPAGELAAEDGACTATTPTGFKDAVFRCIAHAGHNGPHEAWGDSGLLARWDDADAPAKADAR